MMSPKERSVAPRRMVSRLSATRITARPTRNRFFLRLNLMYPSAVSSE